MPAVEAVLLACACTKRRRPHQIALLKTVTYYGGAVRTGWTSLVTERTPLILEEANPLILHKTLTIGKIPPHKAGDLPPDGRLGP
ncbi:hypothetical protein EGR_07489 [Echinococcus granulosus]|uniref:Uncharacterized protein n=1 Tax=Echinococcus granulosus TaxID=6210 RepID=W6UHV7_ECHGR|nr:hypothetical protein EGR_07489 [Echinococcus granulosus]EUB57682.1 hypothetical protein EGR_07489 [Echinococcus granulosus]